MGSLFSPLSPLVSVKLYGAIGLNVSSPLSNKFSTLAAAQAANQISIAGCTFSSGSTAVACTDSSFVSVGMPISGSGIAAGTTVAAIVDGANFTLSQNTTGAGSGVSLTSSFVTSLTDESDWLGLQTAIWLNGSVYIPAGVYHLGNKTLLIKSTAMSQGLVVEGAGPGASFLVTGSGTNDAVQVMIPYCLIRDLAIGFNGTDGIGGQGSGIILDTGHPENNPPRYTNNFHLDHVFVIGFAQGVFNPYKWDETSITRSVARHCGSGIHTIGNLDLMSITTSDYVAPVVKTAMSSAALTNGSPTLTCASTANVYAGMLVQATGLSDDARVLSVDSATQLTLSENASATNTGLTATAFSVALWVGSNGRAKWSGGVIGAGYTLYGSTNAGCQIIGEGLHCEGTGGTYIYIPASSKGKIIDCFFADASGVNFIAFLNSSASFTVDDISSAAGAITIWSADHNDVRAYNCTNPITVNVFGSYTYAAGPWHTAEPFESPGTTPAWPSPSQDNENLFVAQISFPSSAGVTLLYQCRRVGSSWLYQNVGADPEVTVSALPTDGSWLRAIVTDANATTFNSTVAGSGTNIVPVFWNGTNWKIG